MSKDLRYARVFVSIYGDEEQRKASLEVLQRAGGFLKGQLGRRLELRWVPELNFVIDDTLDRSERIDELLEESGGSENE